MAGGTTATPSAGEPRNVAELHCPDGAWASAKLLTLLRENDGAVSDEEHTVFGPHPHRSGEYETLGVLTEFNDVSSRVAVVDAGDVLFDDWPFIELSGDEVRSGANQFHAASVGLMVGLGAFETREQRVMNIDCSSVETLAQVVRKNLHIARKDDEVDVVLVDDRHDR